MVTIVSVTVVKVGKVTIVTVTVGPVPTMSYHLPKPYRENSNKLGGSAVALIWTGPNFGLALTTKPFIYETRAFTKPPLFQRNRNRNRGGLVIGLESPTSIRLFVYT